MLPPWWKMWWTLRARAATGPSCPVDSWWIVWPVRPFFWLDIFIVAESAWSRIESGDRCGSCRPSFQNPISLTRNCWVRVAQTHLPFHLTRHSLVYSLLRSGKEKAMRARSPGAAAWRRLPVACPRRYASSGTSTGTVICGIDGRSCRRNPSINHLRGKIFKAY